MKWLELKIPPAIVLMLCTLLSALAKKYAIGLFRPVKQLDIWVGLSFTIAFIILIAGIVAFRRAKTTVDPTDPQSATTLVTNGVFRFTRNPMYLGMVILLVSATLYLGTWIGFVSVALFIIYITQFQIKPEERIVEQLFGQPYVEYKNSVRRWI
ncbi:isoprenylcysteine carboxylmethyltransferase family protein [Aliiglaciecola litoralis]|uniref:Isoprenylcysteine carboxylmethyltransferase family protein n=1 Tax=Aliiglaciecola litoralis TaxID=582857 RepID=A0ABP3WX39_9ALTE